MATIKIDFSESELSEMLYVASLFSKVGEIGISASDDRIEEFYEDNNGSDWDIMAKWLIKGGFCFIDMNKCQPTDTGYDNNKIHTFTYHSLCKTLEMAFNGFKEFDDAVGLDKAVNVLKGEFSPLDAAFILMYASCGKIFLS